MSSIPKSNAVACDEIALDIGFSAAVSTIADQLFPCGFAVAEDAPQTYEKLITRLDAGLGMAVYSGGSDRTIFGRPDVNYAFRAWHDWCHWRGHHDFSFKGERAACAMQAKHLVALFGDGRCTRQWQRILHAEIIGQREYFDRHGAFPEDQHAFVERYLARERIQLGE
jgi:hypothetical protein